ncbi:40-residue YVTN beta-propeller repeat-containing protein [Streptomyces davaonensis JCM 4913]|uniref:40-residue YVTN beta-propeller repeat-containing protein n=1 Tax=Streptomyces davaonensis (strain DSM 101723 / JCM 4913 / KCC S-0913 / 768) TaxID=1214101 RepID=K4QXW9_STRDJ|nr:ThuA domain-containing protein [Streptomyces davaonensis]CCK25224.1 40-residue YVTN beta-propeller repeat-containing protein [Streptomyces davaonensis JCM 4913]
MLRLPRPPIVVRLLTLLALLLGLTALPAHAAPQAPSFKVIAFYNGTWDAAHIDFVKEANQWFPRAAAENNFTYTATTDWNLLANGGVDAYQVVLFLDDAPQTAAQRAGFERYMRAGGGWLGFHVSAFTTDAASWPWYYNQFLGSGNFRSNTWGPTTAVLRTENRTHPATTALPATFTSAVSEWYSWSNDLRNNPDIRILASVDPSSFPLGTDPDQSWYSGYYPILWTNSQYRMLYANFGHNAMDYATNTRLSSTFASATQNRFLIDGLKWLGGADTDPGPQDPISDTAWYSLTNAGNGTCVDARAAGTANGTVIQQYTCNGTNAQQFQFRPTDGGYTRIANRGNPQQVIDVTDVSTADNAPLQLWSYGGGGNQQWQPVREESGSYRFVARHSGKCLSSSGSSANSVQLVQRACDGSGAQSFRLTEHP